MLFESSIDQRGADGGQADITQVILIIEWPSKEAADSFYESDEYRPYREARREGAESEFFLVAGEDVNGVARISGR
ncbi:MAG: DUF1330 domain-containing protein [Solirubrobacteraceae bacterium]